MHRHACRLISTFAVCMALHVANSTSSAGVTFVTDEATFHSLSGPLSNQTFGAANVPAGGTFENEPLNSSTNDGIFKKGQILPGLSFTSASGNGLYILGPGDNTFFNPPANNANTSVTTNFFNDTLILNFSLSQHAVGLGLLGTLGTDVEVDVYSTKHILLGSLLEQPPIAGVGQFLGLIGTLGDTIGSIDLSIPFSTGSDSVLVDRVQFTALPEPGSLAMLTVGLGAMAGFSLRRTGVRKSKKST